MTRPISAAQWYLARDGQQYGPITDAELAKLAELGHLKPSDLLWRPGFPDWRPAAAVVPPHTMVRRPAPVTPEPCPPAYSAAAQKFESNRMRPAGGQPQQWLESEQFESEEEIAENPRPRRIGRWLRRTAALLFFGSALAAAGWLLYPHRETIAQHAATFKIPEKLASVWKAIERGGVSHAPIGSFGDSPEAIDDMLQRTLLWRTAKREFGEWYAARVKEAAQLRGENQSDMAIAQHLAKAIVTLRRQHAPDALSAGLPRLKQIASAFVENLSQLKRHSVDACFGMIAQGETSPIIVELMQSPDYTGPLQLQTAAVLEAIAEGRKIPRVYPAPQKADYDTLAALLTERGWSQADLTLFSDARAFGSAKPDRVCQMVQDWFAAQLALKDDEIQLRLLADALRPLVAG
jgi:hypothetical protein